MRIHRYCRKPYTDQSDVQCSDGLSGPSHVPGEKHHQHQHGGLAIIADDVAVGSDGSAVLSVHKNGFYKDEVYLIGTPFPSSTPEPLLSRYAGSDNLAGTTLSILSFDLNPEVLYLC